MRGAMLGETRDECWWLVPMLLYHGALFHGNAIQVEACDDALGKRVQIQGTKKKRPRRKRRLKI